MAERLIAWPETLPPRPLARGFSYKPQENVVRFQPDVGEALERVRSSTEAVAVQASFWMTARQARIVIDFWRRRLDYGTGAFTFADPVMGDVVPFKMRRPRPTAIGGNRYIVHVAMQRLP